MNTLSSGGIEAIENASLDAVQQREYTRTFIENFLLSNFSECRLPYLECDCRWFYELSNQQTTFVYSGLTQFWSNCATFGVFHSILTRILGFPSSSSGSINSSSRILSLFNEKVNNTIVYLTWPCISHGLTVIFTGEYQGFPPDIPLIL